ncbi:protein kinase domain-containing protein [Actinomadura formosensis]|uniref:protein kinase domain-containing protein n=1 Tax=Actinomadura formosensis TaxID=60706 RepID=UPI003D935F71
MKLGDTINGYQVITRPGNDDAGKSVWAFAAKNGSQYFIKQFLEPKRPRGDSTASPRSKELRLQECLEFEQRQRTVARVLESQHGRPGTGNLVLPLDFFADGSTYYKVTEKVEVAGREPESFSAREKLTLLRTLGLSLQLLHGIGIVHGDLKPTNVLIQRKSEDRAFYRARLIDFDDAYISEEPPAADVMGGDQLFGAPEFIRYLHGDPVVRARDLTVRADVFSLALLTHHYLTESLPGHDDAFAAPAEAVAAGERLRWDARLSAPVRDLLIAMTSPSPAERPGVEDFLDTMKDPALCALNGPAPAASPATRLRGIRSGDSQPPAAPRPSAPTTPAVPAPPPGPSSGRASRLRINLGGDGRP